jgi:hypothetical protein
MGVFYGSILWEYSVGVLYGNIQTTCVAAMHLGGVAAMHLRGSRGGIKNNAKKLLTG